MFADKTVYFASIQFYFAATNLYAASMRAFNGLVTPAHLLFAAVGLLGCLVGNYVGRMMFEKLNADKLKVIIYLGMVASGILMLF